MGSEWRKEDNDDEGEHRQVNKKKLKGGKKIPLFHRSIDKVAESQQPRTFQALNLEAGVSIPNHDEIEKQLQKS